MAADSGIEWTEATWNPTSGCSKISPGCKNCYAETMTKRLKAMGQQKYKKGFLYTEHPSDVNLPLTWKKPKKIFVNSMSDLFHEKSIFEFTGRCFSTMIQADHHDYQILTKRPKRMAEFSELFFKYFDHKIPNFMWMGTSIESRKYISRINDLRRVKCHTRFISFEPLLGSVGKVNLKGIDWAIIGGESGHHYRPVQKEWIEEIIRQCKDQNVAVFFKQWGGFRPKAGGRTINRRKYSQYPKIKKKNLLKNINFNESAFAKMCLMHEIKRDDKKEILAAR